MNTKLLEILIAILAATLPCHFILAQNQQTNNATAETNNATAELQNLVTKVRADLQAGKTTKAELSDDLKQFDTLLAEHKDEKTEAVAEILYVKATIYAQVFQDTATADALMKQLTNDFSGTELVTMLQKQQEQEAEADKVQANLTIGSQFPDFNEKDVMGNPVSIAKYKGKVVLIDFWATWCAPCVMEMPGIIATYQKYHDKGFEVIGISQDQDQQKLLDFIKQNDMPWQQFFDGDKDLALKYGVQVIPTTFLLDRNGKIIAKDLRGEDLADAVAKALSK